MRTIASTFQSREEAEAARAQLQGIGVASDRIMLKGVFGAPEEGLGAGGIFLSAKVEPEQVGAATEILKGRASDAAPEARAETHRPVEPPVTRHAPEARPVPPSPSRGDRIEFGGPAAPPVAAHRPSPAFTAGDSVRPQSDALTMRPGDESWRQMSRSLVVFALLLVAAFVIGAMLGLAT